MIHLDTHTLVRVAGRRMRQIGPAARRLIEREPIQISPMVALELEILHEIGKLHNEPQRILDVAHRDHGVATSRTRFDSIAAAARLLGWTRDPFDRLIVANAMADGVRLITADQTILANFAGAVW